MTLAIKQSSLTGRRNMGCGPIRCWTSKRVGAVSTLPILPFRKFSHRLQRMPRLDCRSIPTEMILCNKEVLCSYSRRHCKMLLTLKACSEDRLLRVCSCSIRPHQIVKPVSSPQTSRTTAGSRHTVVSSNSNFGPGNYTTKILTCRNAGHRADRRVDRTNEICHEAPGRTWKTAIKPRHSLRKASLAQSYLVCSRINRQ